MIDFSIWWKCFCWWVVFIRCVVFLKKVCVLVVIIIVLSFFCLYMEFENILLFGCLMIVIDFLVNVDWLIVNGLLFNSWVLVGMMLFNLMEMMFLGIKMDVFILLYILFWSIFVFNVRVCMSVVVVFFVFVFLI